MRTPGGDAGHLGDVLGNRMGEGQGREAADVRVRREPVRHQEGMGDAFSPGRRQGIQAAPQLLHPAGAHPARELASDVGGVAGAGQQQARLEHRLLGDDGDQIPEFHRDNLPEMMICRDIPVPPSHPSPLPAPAPTGNVPARWRSYLSVQASREAGICPLRASVSSRAPPGGSPPRRRRSHPGTPIQARHDRVPATIGRHDGPAVQCLRNSCTSDPTRATG